MSFSAAKSNRKAAQVAVTRDDAPGSGLAKALKARFRRRPEPSPPSSEEEDALVWDTPNPFGEPDPELAHIHTLIQAEIDRTRRLEDVGPLDAIHAVGHVNDNDDDDDTDNDEEVDDGDADDEDEDDSDEEDNPPITLPLRFIPSSDEDSEEESPRAKARAILGPEASLAF